MKKRIFEILCLALVFLAAAACRKDGVSDVDITGQWHLESSDKIDIGTNGIDVYVSFLDNGRFEMYQKITAGYYRYFSGTYTVTGDNAAGTYSDGTSWGSQYRVSVDGDTLVMTSLSGEQEECRYSRTSIPDEVVSGSVDFRSTDKGEVTARWL